MTALLEVEAVGKVFGGLVAVSDVSFTLAQGEIVGLMGANGAGKTTLFNLISGAMAPTSGRVRFEGCAIEGRRPDEICRRGIGRTFQIVKPFPGMTVAENVAVGVLYGARRRTPSAREVAAETDAVLAEMGLSAMRDKLAGELTLAGRKRLEVARALASRPKLLMLDEVMAGLTPIEAAGALDMLRQVHETRGTTMLVVEHNLRAMMQLCQRIVVMHHGEKIGEGPPEVVIRDEKVIQAYLGAQA
ncbi:ABC transporter ATP-binding protein [Zavarzinia compransoris]|uniref:ABC transporter ATP-binding protein n=1 Tax=Zavarzinia marina TaxID=2911065 RepID=UPI001F29B6BE|nr:ABC transporter ATP-binding protein [Zavarzinia marina]MCF4167369.1 ABC transporter ATP-binding protein [Zavarzinia marina]